MMLTTFLKQVGYDWKHQLATSACVVNYTCIHDVPMVTRYFNRCVGTVVGLQVVSHSNPKCMLYYVPPLV